MQIYLVGGAVRDMLLKLPQSDKDYVVFGATPDEMKNLGFIEVGKNFPVFLHPVTKEEYALARREIKTGLKHTDFKFDFSKDVTKEEDVLRRDFTMNALMYNEQNHELIDLVGGKIDIENKIIRHITDKHFPEDPLRVLRMCRFSAQLDFEIASQTLELAKIMVTKGDLKNLSPERIFQEFEKALTTKHFEKFLISMHECFALNEILPEIELLYQSHIQKWQKLFQNDSVLKPVIKYALFVSDLTFEQIQNIEKRLKIPKIYSDFAKCYHQNKDILFEKSPFAKDMILFLNHVSRFQNKERLESVFEAALTELEADENKVFLKEILQKNIERLRLNFEIQKSLHATDMPSFETLKKDKEFKQKILDFRTEKFV